MGNSKTIEAASSDDENDIDDPITRKQKKEMRKMIQEDRAKFSYATCDIIKAIFCCVAFCPIRKLRTMPFKFTRTIMRYKQGEEKIDKELDISNIILRLRTLNYFMKMILDKD